MPRRRTSLKTTRSSKKKHLRNLRIKIQLKKALKKFDSLLSAKNIEDAKTALKSIMSQLDKAAKKNIIHSKTADRRKSRLTKRLGRTA